MIEEISGNKNPKNILKIVVVSMLLLLVVSILAFFIVFHVREIEVVGNTRYTEQEIRDMALTGPFAANSLLITWLKGSQDDIDIPFLNGFKVEQVSNNKIRIIVSEKQIIGYISYQDNDMYFDKDGLIVESIVVKNDEGKQVIKGEEVESIKPEPLDDEEASDETKFTAAVTNVPLIEGLDIKEAVLHTKLKVADDQVFNTIWGITRMVEKFGVQPDKVVFDEEGRVTMHYDNIRVLIGDDNLLEEKISRAAAILPKLTGKSGELHLDDYREGVDSIVFSGDVAEKVAGEPIEDEEAVKEPIEDAEATKEDD